MKKEAIVVHSGGMDSSIVLASAIKIHQAENILSLSFTYNQRHSEEISRAKAICKKWHVDHIILDISCLSEITENALINSNLEIAKNNDGIPNTLVVGRNGLMGRIAAIHAHKLLANQIYMGVIGVEADNSGYRDCDRNYMDKLQELLRIDLNNEKFEIKTPLVEMTKKETMMLAYQLGVLEYLLEETITCYEGIEKFGCGQCPACLLRNMGIKNFIVENPNLDINFSYKDKILNFTYLFI